MKCALVFFLSFAIVPQSNDTASADKPNPYLNSKVGDWTTYSCKTNIFAPYQTKTSVVSKNETEVELAVEAEINGEQTRLQFKYDLQSSLDPMYMSLVMGSKPVVKKLGSGKEKITIGDKTYSCEWLHLETTITVGGLTVTNKTKTWTCKDVPCGGMVKSEFEGNGMKMSFELANYGGRK